MHNTEQDPQQAALMDAIDQQRETDPLVGAKIGAKEIVNRLLGAMKNERGVHAESLLCALGSLAGYACQASLRAKAAQEGKPETAYFVTVEGADGRSYFFGDPLNELLLESTYSVWGLAAWAAQEQGAEKFPDVKELFSHVSATVGTEAFGQPRFVEGHSAGDTPATYVKYLWPQFLPIAEQLCASPDEWPVMYGIAIQQAIEMCGSVVPGELALSIVLESAVPMSKIDLAAV